MLNTEPFHSSIKFYSIEGPLPHSTTSAAGISPAFVVYSNIMLLKLLNATN